MKLNPPLYDFFEELRRHKKGLGIDDYTILLEVLMHDIAEENLAYLHDKNAVLRLCKLLWLKPKDDKEAFERLFEEYWKTVIFNKEDFSPPKISEPKTDSSTNTSPKNTHNQQTEKTGKEDDTQKQSDLPTQPQPSDSLDKVYLNLNEIKHQKEHSAEGSRRSFHFVDKYIPFQRRNVGQAWRFLQKNQTMGVSDEVDIEETIRQLLQKGTLQKLYYKRTQRNDLTMLTLIEHKGGMIAFKNLAMELAQSAKTSAGIDNKVFFFQRIPHLLKPNDEKTYCLYKNEIETEFETLDNVWAMLKKNTPVLIISDAGAVGNYLDYERIRKTYDFLATLQTYTQKIVWLNPMPADRRAHNTAEYIAKQVPTFNADLNGLKQAIRFLRGKKR